MKITRRWYYLLISCILFIPACRKEQIEIVPEHTYSVGRSVRLHDLEFLSDSCWIACGGNRSHEGWFFRTTDAGNSWHLTPTNNQRSLYCMAFIDSLHGLAGSEQLELYRTVDGGKTWQFHWLGNQVPMHEQDRPTIRDIYMVNDSLWYFCGGEVLYKGVFYQTLNAGQQWSFQVDEHEYRRLCIQQGFGAVVGHGAAKYFNSGSDHLRWSDFSNDFMTGIAPVASNQWLGVAQSGTIYQSSDSGKSWTSCWRPPHRLQSTIWNDVDSFDQKVLAVGNDGQMIWSSDGGATWQVQQLSVRANLLAVRYFKQQWFVTTDVGQILRFRM